MIIKICPECGSENIYFSPKRTAYVCEDCESSFIKPEKKRYCPTEEDYAAGFDGDKVAGTISHIPPVDTRVVKVFLASSTVDAVKDKREMISAAVCTANGRDESLYIDLYHCEDDDRSKRGRTQQEEYNEKIRECDVFVLLSENSELGGITLNEEVKLAAEQKRERGIKLFVFADKSSPADTERGANWRRFKNEYLPLFEPIFSYKNEENLEEKAKRFIEAIRADSSIGTVYEGCSRLEYNIELIGSDSSAKKYLCAIADRLNTLNNRFVERDPYQSLLFKVKICCDDGISRINPMNDNYFVIPCDEKSCSEGCKGRVFAKIEECFRSAKDKTDVSLFRGENESGRAYLHEHEKKLFEIMDSNYSYSFSHKDTVVNKPTMNERLSDIREAYAYLEEGLSYLHQKNYFEAERCLLAGAEFGFPTACFYLGYIYAKIDGFIDMEKSEKYTLLAADSGVIMAMHNMGCIFLKKLQKESQPEKNKELIRKTEKYCKAAGKAGVDWAYYNLGLMYTLVGRQTDAVKAYKAAADKGEVKSQYNLAVLYQQMGKVKDAAEYYAKAAAAGHKEAMVNLAAIYRDAGQLSAADKLMSHAAGLGQTKALLYLGSENLNKGNTREAEKYFRQAADKGEAEAQFMMGCLLANRGDAKGSEKYFLAAYSNGSEMEAEFRSNCENELGLIYERKNQLDKAERFFRLSADGGNSVGEYNLGRFLWKYYADKRLDEAEKYYRRAAEKGDEDAQRELNMLLSAKNMK